MAKKTQKKRKADKRMIINLPLKDFQHPPERTEKASSIKISDLTAQMLLIQAKEEISHSHSEDEQEPFTCAAQLLYHFCSTK
jgi:hypothetical protein